MNASQADDALRTVSLQATFVNGSGGALAGAELALVTGIAHASAIRRPPAHPAEQGPERADVSASEAGLKAPQQEQEGQQKGHE